MVPVAARRVFAPEGLEEMRKIGFGKFIGPVLKSQADSVDRAITVHRHGRAWWRMFNGISAKVAKDDGKQCRVGLYAQIGRKHDSGFGLAFGSTSAPWAPGGGKRLRQ